MKILVSALEPSSNLHLKELLKHLKNVEIKGIFEKSLGEPLLDISEFSVMGFIDILPKIYQAKIAIKEMAKLSKECDKVLLIDAPAFNIPLAKEIKKQNPNIQINYYILPKAWAWKQKRARVVRKYCDNLLSIFPFEDKFYENSIYVGNPLLDMITDYKTTTFKNGNIALLAGSRKSEIKSLMPLFRELKNSLNKNYTIVIPPFFSDTQISEIYGDLSGFNISRDTLKSLKESEYAFICSGTATLESALIGTPFTLVYKAKKIDFFIAKMFVKLKYIGLANIIFDFYGLKQFHDELIQNDLTVENLIKSYDSFSEKEFFENVVKLREILKCGSSKKVANILSNK